MKKGVIIFLIIIIVLVIGFILLSVFNKHNSSANSTSNTNKSTSVSTSASSIKGVGLSPISFSGSNFTSFFPVATDAVGAISWGGDWHQLAQDGSAPDILAKLSKQYSYTPVIIVDLPNVSDESQFISTVSDFVKNNNLKYVGIGNEINLKSSSDLSIGLGIFNATYDAIKKVSPNTVVFTIFQYEALNGLQGGLFGKTNNLPTQWNLLNEASKADAIGFTTYPGLVYNNPSDVPTDYYSRISSHTNKPVIFTEVGWFRNGNSLGSQWTSSQQEQADFINLFFNQTKSLNSPLKIWAFLYDQNVQSPFNTMGLLETNQTDSVAYEAWKND